MKRKLNEGGVALLEPPARGLSTREALRLVYTFEDVLVAVKRSRPRDKAIRNALATIASLRDDLEDRYDGEEADVALAEMKRTGEKSVPLEEVARKLGL